MAGQMQAFVAMHGQEWQKGVLSRCFPHKMSWPLTLHHSAGTADRRMRVIVSDVGAPHLNTYPERWVGRGGRNASCTGSCECHGLSFYWLGRPYIVFSGKDQQQHAWQYRCKLIRKNAVILRAKLLTRRSKPFWALHINYNLFSSQ